MSVHPTQLFTLLLSQGDFSRLEDALEKTRSRMAEVGEEDLWRYWKGQALLARGQTEAASELVLQLTNPDHAAALDLQVRRVAAKAAGDLRPVAELLEGRYQAEGDAMLLWELCELYHEQENWGAIAARARELVAAIATPDALRLALMGSERTGEHQLCLELLEGHANLFPTGRLPADLRRLLIQCRMVVGLPMQALKEAEALALESGEVGDQAAVVELRFASADPQGAALASRELLGRTDVSPTVHLQLALRFQAEDSTTAQAHLDRAVSGGERTPEFLAAALGLAFRLNREDLQRQLMPDFVAAARENEGAIRRLQLDDAADFLRKDGEDRARTEELYRGGEIPLQVALEHLGGSLARVYDQRFHLDPGINWPPGGALHTRHGGRGLPSPTRDVRRLTLDLTALLLAEELGLLDVVVRTFAPVYLPPSTIIALAKQIEETLPHQPSRLETMKLIQGLLTDGPLQVLSEALPLDPLDHIEPGPGRPTPAWRRLLAEARRTGGTLVDHLPLRAGIPQMPVELTMEEEGAIVGCLSVLTSLEMAGKLTVEQRRFAQEHLAETARGESARILAAGTKLYLDGGIAELLATAGLLPTACGYFEVIAEEWQRREVDAILRTATRMERLGARLRALRARVHDWLGSGHLLLLPSLKDEKPRNWGPETQCLLELTAAPSELGSWVWMDDRFLNARTHCGEAPIITVFGVLGELRRRGVLDAQAYLAKIHTLRAANLRLVPITAEEILHHVRAAQVVGDQLIETPELSVLRRYLAGCLYERDRFQVPPQPDGSPQPLGEIRFVMDAQEAVREAIAPLWREPGEEPTRKARADWILQSLWIDHAVSPWLMRQEGSSEKRSSVQGSSLAQLYVQGIGMKGNRQRRDPEGLAPRLAYFEWLHTRMATDPATMEVVARNLVEAFTGELDGDGAFTEAERTYVEALKGEVLLDLPEPLRKAVHLPRSVWERLGIRRRPVVQTEEAKFEAGAFWRAGARALRGQPARIATLGGEKTFQMTHQTEEGRPILKLAAESDAGGFTLLDPIFSALARDRTARETALVTHREWFDCDETLFRQQVERIGGLEDAPERIRQIQGWRNNSAACFYLNLSNRVRDREKLTLGDLEPPSIQGLLNHLRLPRPSKDGALPGLLAQGAKLLLREEGFTEAFGRLSTLPIALPEEVYEACAALTVEARKAWQSQATRELTSPVARIHLAAAIARVEPGQTAAALTILAEFADDQGENLVAAFRTTLRWTLRRLQTRSDATGCSAGLMLTMAWLHTSKLMHLLCDHKSGSRMAKFFEEASRPSPADIFAVHRELDHDIVAPPRLQTPFLLVQGLAALWRPSMVDETSREALTALVRRLCYQPEEGENLIPQVQLLFDPTLYRNAMGSFLGGDLGDAVGSRLGPELAAPFYGANLAPGVAVSLEALRVDPVQPAHWALLQSVLGEISPWKDLREATRSLLLESSFRKLAGLDAPMHRAALFFVLQQAANFSDEAVIGHLCKELSALAAPDQLGGPAGVLTAHTSLLVLECAHFLARAQGDEVTAAREFARLTEDLVKARPALAREWWARLRLFFTRLPLTTVHELWPTFLLLRHASP